MFPELYPQTKTHWERLCFAGYCGSRKDCSSAFWGFLGWGWQDDLMGRKQVTVTIKTGRFFLLDSKPRGWKLLKVGEFFVLSISFLFLEVIKMKTIFFCVDKKKS